MALRCSNAVPKPVSQLLRIFIAPSNDFRREFRRVARSCRCVLISVDGMRRFSASWLGGSRHESWE